MFIYVCYSAQLAEERAILDGVRAYAMAMHLDWQVIPCPLHQRLSMQALERARAPGVVISRTDPRTLSAQAAALPWVQWPTPGQTPSGDAAVSFDQHAVARAAAEYLQGQGVASFAIRYRRSGRQAAYMASRYAAFTAAVEALGKPVHVLAFAAGSRQQYRDELAAFCAALEQPIGLYVFHDRIADALLVDVQDIGLRVPEDVLVLGGSGAAVEQHPEFPVSTVRLPFQALGRAAAAQAHKLLCGSRPEPLHCEVPALGVIERRSTRLLQYHKDKVVGKAIQYLARNEQAIPSVTSLAQQCQVDRKVLYEHFMQCLRLSPKAWLSEQAMCRASRLLADTDMMLPAIAKACGFAQRMQFSRRFRQRFGMSPKEFRAHHSGQGSRGSVRLGSNG